MNHQAISVGGNISTVALLFPALVLASNAIAQCMYSVQTIESPACPQTTTPIGYDINNHGHVCGTYSPCLGLQQPFFWSAEKGFVFIDLDQSSASADALNDDDAVVGTVSYAVWLDIQPTPYRWQGGNAVFLNPLPPTSPPNRVPALRGYAFDVANDGTVVGSWGSTGLSAFRWLPGSAFDGLNADIGFPLTSTAESLGINSSGWICGHVTTFEGPNAYRGFLLTQSGCTILPVVEGGLTSEALGVSSNGYVCGWGRRRAQDGEVYVRGFVWRDGRMQDVGSPVPAKPKTYAYEVNALGQAVGGFGPPGELGFLWQDGASYYLKTLLSNSPQIAAVKCAYGINDRGQIVGYGSGVSIVLTPIRTRPGDATIDCKVDERDILAVIEFWGNEYAMPDMPGDLNGDGKVNGIDLGMVLGDWGEVAAAY